MHGIDGGEQDLDDSFAARGQAGIGATIMGRNMFGPIRGRWDNENWTGWWGNNPPFHHPVFVLAHHLYANPSFPALVLVFVFSKARFPADAARCNYRLAA